ncbi:BgTH12-01519 [Blumeria graminis f. sp. triticale]|uniref:BgTH12-01519 n=1 Tax=Blumeria graminis f. sp. triticale TaxID=1689686 RepID=A0A9W4CZL6_BLUGR|nr:BgTH12-01519 [Blumeria graminis f. sp. triticale]
MQVNVGRGAYAHNMALQLAHENNIEALLIQEPWILKDLTAKRSISHPKFALFSPLDEWHTRPRVLTYISSSKGLRSYQSAINTSPDLLQVVIYTGRGRKIAVWNVYNSPAGLIRAGEGLKMLIESTGTPEFVGGEFNLRHLIWDSHATYTSQGGADLLEWAREKELILLNPTEISTHKGGGTLDLAFSSLAGAKCEIPSDLYTTSDHEKMVTTLTGE